MGEELGDEIDPAPSTPVRKPSSIADDKDRARLELRLIHEELETLRCRREDLERRRRQLFAVSIPPRPASIHRGSGGPSTRYKPLTVTDRLLDSVPSPISVPRDNYRYLASSCQLHTDGAARGHRSCEGSVWSHTSSRTGPDSDSRARRSASSSCPSVNALFAKKIPLERERRRRLKETPHLVMKNSMRQAAEEDSALIMGDFLPENQSKAYTFGRERRFMPVIGQRGSYYLATDVALAQDRARMVTSRKDLTLYDDFSGTPGPGAYTPRYSKVSKPSPLAELYM